MAVYACLLTMVSGASAWALEAEDILVLANRQENEGVELARFYMQERGIPPENLLLIRTAANEGIPRVFYEDEIAEPVREYLAAKPDISCLLLFYGMPLRIDGQLSAPEKPEMEQNNSSRRLRDPVASVDSELSLVRIKDPPVDGWVLNPYFLQFQNQKTRYQKEQVLMVSRLDGPNAATVRRVITDSLATEKKGLTGTAYFDARWPRPRPEKRGKLEGYGLYDNAIHEAAKNMEAVLDTVVDQQERLFQPGEAVNAALYCGWYSLAKYVDAFDWQPGAVAYHIASAECTTLKKRGSQVWCKRLLEAGVAATIGPVAEPYVQAFPLPQIFFGLLADGDFTLVEAYSLSVPFISWKMVLIGDPLYQPFRSRGLLP